MEITSKEELYDKCENMEEFYDKYYVPSLKRALSLEQALDEIKKICDSIPKEHSICDIGKIHDIEEIIKKVKGDDK